MSKNKNMFLLNRNFASPLRSSFDGGFSAILRCLRGFAFVRSLRCMRPGAFTLVEMLMALLIVSVILSASIPVITSRTKAQSQNYSKYSPMPIGAIIMWKVDGAMPDNTWLEANGQAIPNGIEYEQCRKVYGSRLPDLRGADNEFYTNLNNYLSKDIKNYLQNAIKPIPQNLIGIWGTNAAIPDGWSEATEYRGVFLRGYGSVYSSHYGGVTHSSGAIGTLQGDAIRNNASGSICIHYWYLASADGIFTPSALNTAYVQNGNIASTQRGYSCASYNFGNKFPTANEIRPVNKAVKYIKYTRSAALPTMPQAPNYTKKFRYIVKVKN